MVCWFIHVIYSSLLIFGGHQKFMLTAHPKWDPNRNVTISQLQPKCHNLQALSCEGKHVEQGADICKVRERLPSPHVNEFFFISIRYSINQTHYHGCSCWHNAHTNSLCQPFPHQKILRFFKCGALERMKLNGPCNQNENTGYRRYKITFLIQGLICSQVSTCPVMWTDLMPHCRTLHEGEETRERI